MARVLVKVDVRSPSTLLTALREQREQRQQLGERSFSFSVDDGARNIGYVLLEWGPFQSVRKFVDSQAAKDLIASWPIAGVIEVLALRDMEEEFRENASRRGGPDA